MVMTNVLYKGMWCPVALGISCSVVFQAVASVFILCHTEVQEVILLILIFGMFTETCISEALEKCLLELI